MVLLVPFGGALRKMSIGGNICAYWCLLVVAFGADVGGGGAQETLVVFGGTIGSYWLCLLGVPVGGAYWWGIGSKCTPE